MGKLIEFKVYSYTSNYFDGKIIHNKLREEYKYIYD